MAEMNATDKQNLILTGLRKLQVAYQLPEPPNGYIPMLKDFLHKNNWKGRAEYLPVIELLLIDPEYSKNAVFNKYPNYADFERLRRKLNISVQTDFKSGLATVLNDNWWMIEGFMSERSQQELDAIQNAGGIKDLYARANREDYPTAIPKLIDEVIECFKDIKDGAKVIQITDRTQKTIGLSDAIKQIGSN